VRGLVSGGAQLARFQPENGIAGWRVKMTRATAGQALGTPAYAAGRVFIGGGMGSQEAYAFAADSGAMNWAMRFSDNGPSNPVVVGDQVYYATESCTLYALNVRDGRSRWSKFLSSSLYSMPMAAGDSIVISFPTQGYALASFAAKDGRLQWHAPLPGDSFTAPQMGGERTYVTTRAGTGYCYSLCKGRLLWTRDVHALAPPKLVDE